MKFSKLRRRLWPCKSDRMFAKQIFTPEKLAQFETLKGCLKKLKAGEDITKEEATDIFWLTVKDFKSEEMYYTILEWFDLVKQKIENDEMGNFIMSVPYTVPGNCYMGANGKALFLDDVINTLLRKVEEGKLPIEIFIVTHLFNLTDIFGVKEKDVSYKKYIVRDAWINIGEHLAFKGRLLCEFYLELINNSFVRAGGFFPLLVENAKTAKLDPEKMYFCSAIGDSIGKYFPVALVGSVPPNPKRIEGVQTFWVHKKNKETADRMLNALTTENIIEKIKSFGVEVDIDGRSLSWKKYSKVDLNPLDDITLYINSSDEIVVAKHKNKFYMLDNSLTGLDKKNANWGMVDSIVVKSAIEAIVDENAQPSLTIQR